MFKVLLNYLGMDKAKFGTFLIITFSTCIYWWSGIKSVIYEPFRQALGVSNAQLGFLLGLIGFVQIFGYALLGWLQDLLPIRKLIAIDLWGYGIFALILGLVPNLPYWFLIIAFAAYGFFGDAIYWPTIQKSTKGLATEKTQAAAFSVQECIRSGVGLCLTWFTLFMFTVGGSNMFGARLSMTVYPIFMMLYSFVVLKFIPKDFLQDQRKEGEPKIKRNGAAMVLRAMKMPIVWTTGFGAAATYLIYVAANTYFLPFVQASFKLSDAAAGIFGIVNSGLMGLIAAGLSGVLATKRFKTTPQWMILLYVLVALVCVAIIVTPHSSNLMIPVVILCCCVTFICVALRAVYYAPIGESGVDADISATAMSIASFIGYCPSFFAYPLFGAIIDKFDTQTAYRIIFTMLAVFSLVGIVACFLGNRVILQRRKQEDAALAMA
ncbi:MFS transporter [Bombiscardovia apis]|uniref:MFS transporter n=1 Tax=Bombiscardovia apis TaxID=2932182 RepID=A0ABN6SDL0_9BIFI|nr:MFS transporter [Bombiscardovia apis]BDR54131.1 MFS transporter [Bombiscardovia apis]